MEKLLLVLALLTVGCASRSKVAEQPSGVQKTAPIAKMDRANIDHHLKSRTSELIGCYDSVLRRNPTLPAGKIVLSWVIDTSGKVQDAKVVETKVAARNVEDCMISIISGIQFSKPSSPLSIKYPFEFTKRM